VSKLTVIIPSAHTKTNVEKRPLPERRGKIVLLVGVRNKRIIGSHHGDVEVNKVLEERRLVVTWITSWQFLVDVAFNVPVSVYIARVVSLDASSLDLFETPLREVDVASTKVTIEILVLQAEGCSKGTELCTVVGSSITDNLYLPVVLGVSNGRVTVARNLVICLGHRSRDGVRVQVSASLSVDKTNDRLVSREAELLLRLVLDLVAVRVEEPVVVGVLVVVTCDLLLSRALGIGLNVRMEQTSTVTHVLQGDAGSVCNLQRAVLSDLGSAQIGLEERAHLGVSGSTVLQNEEMQVEREHVHRQGDKDKTKDTEHEVREQLNLGHLEVSKFVPKVLDGVKSNKSCDEESDPLDTADASN
jgi:hypothetical protein